MSVVLPSFVDLHMHLDKAFTLDPTCNKSGTLDEAIVRFDIVSDLLHGDRLLGTQPVFNLLTLFHAQITLAAPIAPP